jgi:hypothetical protein
MARKKITSLKGWTIMLITSSAGYYTIHLEKGNRTSLITVDADQVFDANGERFEDNT